MNKSVKYGLGTIGMIICAGILSFSGVSKGSDGKIQIIYEAGLFGKYIPCG